MDQKKLQLMEEIVKIILKERYYSTILEEPLFKTENLEKLEIFSTVSGGGLSGQAGALRHGISRALFILIRL